MSEPLSLSLSITFTEEDMVVARAHNTPQDKDMVVARELNRPMYFAAKINGFDIQWALIGTGSDINVMPLSTFKAACIPLNQLVLESISITGVSGLVITLGHVTVDLQVGLIWSETCFHVVDAKHACDIILGAPWISKFKGVISTYHQCFRGKFQGKDVVVKASQTPLPDAFLSMPIALYCQSICSSSSASS